MSVELSVGQKRLHGLLQEPQVNSCVSPIFERLVYTAGWVMDHAEQFAFLAMGAVVVLVSMFGVDAIGFATMLGAIGVIVVVGMAVIVLHSYAEDNCRHVSEATMDNIRDRCATLKKSRNGVDKQLSEATAAFMDGCGGHWKASWLEGVSRALDVRCAELQQTVSKPRTSKKTAAPFTPKKFLQL